MKDAITVIFINHKRGETHDVEIPLGITANELVTGLNEAYNLGIDTNDAKNCYLTSENPIALLRGHSLISDFGLHNGTIIHYVGS